MTTKQAKDIRVGDTIVNNWGEAKKVNHVGKLGVYVHDIEFMLHDGQLIFRQPDEKVEVV